VKQFWMMILVVVVGCGSKSPTQSDPTAMLDALMAPPTQTEIATVRALFDMQTYVCEDAGFETIDTRSGQFANFSLVAYHSAGLRIYGIVTRPKIAGTYPILLYNHGGESGLSAAELDHPLAFAFVQVASSFRSEPVLWFGETYRSEGEPSTWDGDVKDALVMLSCAEKMVDADASRVVCFGGSRGGGVSLLSAIRMPKRFLRVVELFGPTDFFDPIFRADLQAWLDGAVDTRPGVTLLRQEVVEPYLNGVLSLADARLALLRRSALYFADQLPAVQMHHGTVDDIVPISQSDRLAAELENLQANYEYFQYEGKGHDPNLGDELLGRILAFLK
jgi:dipeptidyl aminopeptidase/acylaminoacyl peptidase